MAKLPFKRYRYEAQAAVYNTFNAQRYLATPPSMKLFRAAADQVWQTAVA
jgi:hypothetical protein